MKTIKKIIVFLRMPATIFIFILATIPWYRTIKIRKLEKDITVLKGEISNICDAGMKTVEELMNNQDGLIEAFREIQKLKQIQKGIIYH